MEKCGRCGKAFPGMVVMHISGSCTPCLSPGCVMQKDGEGRAQLAIPDKLCPHTSRVCSPVPLLQSVLSSGCADYTLWIVLPQSLRSHCLLLSPWVRQTLFLGLFELLQAPSLVQPQNGPYVPSLTLLLSSFFLTLIVLQLKYNWCSWMPPSIPSVSFNCRELRQCREP